jgi:hypothetical protein
MLSDKIQIAVLSSPLAKMVKLGLMNLLQQFKETRYNLIYVVLFNTRIYYILYGNNR